MFLQRTKHKLSTKTGIFAFLFVFVFSLAVSTVFPLVWQTPTVSGLTPVQLTDCYKFNGSTYTVDQLDKTKMLLPSAAISANQAKYKECVSIGACSASAPLTDPFKYTVTCQNPASSQGAQLSVTPVISAICGNGGGGDAAISAYQTCSAEVSRVYNVCQNQSNQMTSTSTNQQKADLMANCMAGKMTGINISAVSAAIFKGQSAADNNTAAVNAQDTCVARGGTYDATTGSCSGVEGAEANPPTCEMSINPLSWILCPVITGLVAGVDACRSMLESLLVVRIESGSEAYNDLFTAWSKIRIIGNIILVIALLVIVVGEVIGGGIVEAYTVKKVLPRLLVGAVLINLSFYIVIAFVDIMNIVGLGIYSLMSSTVTGGGLYRVNIDILGGLLGNAGMGALIVGIATGSELLAAGLMFLAVFVLLPALLIMLAVLFVVIIRQGIILVLLILSPVAFALYCLPNTEKYFKKWWEEMFQALLVFPIIMAFFAISTILSSLLGAADLGNATPFKMIVQLIVALAPIALVVMAFKIAGGLLGNVMELGKGLSGKAHQGILGNPNNPDSLQNRRRDRLGERWISARERAVNAGRADNASAFRRRVGKAANYGILEGRRAVYNKKGAEYLEGIFNNANDTIGRDMYIARARNDRGEWGWYRRMELDRQADGSLAPIPGAQRVYSDEAGAAAHAKVMKEFGGNKAALQSSMYYEWKKTGFSEEKINRLQDQYGEILDENGFLRGSEGGEMFSAVKFRHQGDNLTQKHQSYGELGRGSGQYGWKTNFVSHAEEFAHRMDLYGAGKQDEKSFHEAQRGYRQTGDVIDNMIERSGTNENDAQIITQADIDAMPTPPNANAAEYRAELNSYVGKQVGQVKTAHRQYRDASALTDPDQRNSSPGREVSRPTDDGSSPVIAGGFGISSAPVDVQHAARDFRETVSADEAAYLRRNIVNRPSDRPNGTRI